MTWGELWNMADRYYSDGVIECTHNAVYLFTQHGCVNCGLLDKNHAEGKCLFGATEYRCFPASVGEFWKQVTTTHRQRFPRAEDPLPL